MAWKITHREHGFFDLDPVNRYGLGKKAMVRLHVDRGVMIGGRQESPPLYSVSIDRLDQPFKSLDVTSTSADGKDLNVESFRHGFSRREHVEALKMVLASTNDLTQYAQYAEILKAAIAKLEQK